MKSLLILGAMAVVGGVAYVMHKPAEGTNWDNAIGAVASAPGPSAVSTAVQGALDVLAVDAKAKGISLDSTSGDISQKDPELDNEYLQVLGVGGGASVSQHDMATVADALYQAGYLYEAGMTLDAINQTYGVAA